MQTLPPPDREGCPEKQLLLEDIRAAIREIMEIHSAELQAVIDGDFSTGAHTVKLLIAARERKTALIERYREHVLAHGC